LYELPNQEGYLNREEILSYIKKLSLIPLHIAEAGEAKHIFSHVEWHMKGYRVLLKGEIPKSYISAEKEELKSVYALPGAFGRYTKLIK